MPAKSDASPHYRSLPCVPNATTQPDPPSHAPNLRHGRVRPQYHAQNWRESATGEGAWKITHEAHLGASPAFRRTTTCTHSFNVGRRLTLLRHDEIPLT